MNGSQGELQRMIHETTTFGRSFLDTLDDRYPLKTKNIEHCIGLEEKILREHAAGNNAAAFVKLEEYIEVLEEIEIASSQRKKEYEHKDVHTAMKDTLGLVITAPHEIILEKKAELAHMHHVFLGLDTQDDSLLDRVVYRSLQWIELVLLLVIGEVFIGILLGRFANNEKQWLLLLLLASAGVAVFLLRKTKYKRGLFVVIGTILLLYIFLFPRLT